MIAAGALALSGGAVLAIGLLAGVGTAALAWTLFLGDVVRRVRRNQENARRLLQRVPLLPRPAGSDEIARTGLTLELVDELIDRRERTVRQNADLYRTLASSFPEALVTLFNWELRYLVADGPALTAQGLTREHLEGRTIWEVFPPDTVAPLEVAYRGALTGEECFSEVPLGGHLFDLHVIPIRNLDGEIVVGMSIMQDLTDHRHERMEASDRRRARQPAADLGPARKDAADQGNAADQGKEP